MSHTKTRVYPAGPPLEGQWVLSWQTPIMPAPAYWYFATEAEALAAETQMLGGLVEEGGDGSAPTEEVPTTDAQQPAEPSDPATLPLYPTLITSACFPAADATAADHIRAVTVLMHRLLELTVNMHRVVSKESPMLLEKSVAGWLLLTLGHTLQHLETTGLEWMGEHDIVPLDLRAEEIRVARHELENATDMTDDMRVQLEALIAGGPLAPTEWADIVLPDTEQVN